MHGRVRGPTPVVRPSCRAVQVEVPELCAPAARTSSHMRMHMRLAYVARVAYSYLCTGPHTHTSPLKSQRHRLASPPSREPCRRRREHADLRRRAVCVHASPHVGVRRRHRLHRALPGRAWKSLARCGSSRTRPRRRRSRMQPTSVAPWPAGSSPRGSTTALLPSSEDGELAAAHSWVAMAAAAAAPALHTALSNRRDMAQQAQSPTGRYAAPCGGGAAG